MNTFLWTNLPYEDILFFQNNGRSGTIERNTKSEEKLVQIWTYTKKNKQLKPILNQLGHVMT